ncbi:hypothetical protein FB45DRAFT_880227 [Roridomyces roridus]|uniref:Uncharacterized protein n=1 Tax=Roridomyces roridus TaxID=1738132 RepID=A0AAD7AYS0_9AGAR|nr:hypothetical protein FB45DRAFT_880227 [Roridomyces roridus]
MRCSITASQLSLMSAQQGSQTTRDFYQELQTMVRKLPGITERHLRGLNPEDTKLERLVEWALRFERSQSIIDVQASSSDSSEVGLALDSHSTREASQSNELKPAAANKPEKEAISNAWRVGWCCQVVVVRVQQPIRSEALYLSPMSMGKQRRVSKAQETSNSEAEENDDESSGQEVIAASNNDGGSSYRMPAALMISCPDAICNLLFNCG